MRILPGNVLEHGDQTATVPMLYEALAIEPEIIYSVSNLFEDHETTFSSFLARKGLTVSGLFDGIRTPEFQVVSNRQIKWAVKGRSERKGRIVSSVAGNEVGRYHAEFVVSVDTDWFNENETLLCWDLRTVLFVKKKERGSTDGVWNYTCQLMTGDRNEYVNSNLLTAGSELSCGYTAYPELSEDAGEKVTHPEWHTEYMTIQRFKYSISGSAKAHKLLVEHGKGNYLFTDYQYMEVMRRFMYARERQLLFGKASVDATGRVGVTDKFGREITAGNGLIHQGDPSMKFSYTNLSIDWIENLLVNMQLATVDSSGGPEIVIGGGIHFITEFHRVMRGIFEQNPMAFLEGSGDKKGVNATFSYYSFNGAKLYPMWIRAFDDRQAAQKEDIFGVNYRSRMGFALALGNTIGGQGGNVKLLALGNSQEDRRFVERELVGMAGGGVRNPKTNRLMVSSSVDGYELHMLSETGIALMNPLAFAEIVPATRLNS